ncbi:hypothetical protein C8R44DRAFT_854892 [Mycena epipterygia]|nr:hypothetical protein C8R44DRAFT_854892 [Mycena epipterygia]
MSGSCSENPIFEDAPRPIPTHVVQPVQADTVTQDAPDLPSSHGHQEDNLHSLELSAPTTSAVPCTPRKASPLTTTPATPQRASSHDSEAAYRIVEEIQKAVNVELVDAWVEETDSRPFQKYLETTIDQEDPGLDSRVQSWLESYSGYNSDNKRWENIPENPAKEDMLYDPLVKTMTDILKHFGLETEGKYETVIKQRAVKKTHRVTMRHNNNDAAEKPLKSEPDISIFGSGPSATKGTTLSPQPSYSEVASLWEVKREETFEALQKGQVAVYAREVFIQQPNRRFVYVPIMTGEIIRVLRFDRAGCYYSQRIDYHSDAAFFVKLVILLSSLNEELLGFDTSIYWSHGRRFMKMKPGEIFNDTTSCWEPNTEELVFKLADEPVFSRRTIRSRGTVCWRAEYRGKHYIVKDYWRADGRAHESDFLKRLAGIDGVGQMFAFDDDRKSIKAERGFGPTEVMTSDHQSKAVVVNRFFMRLVLPKYGDTLEQAQSARQLLCAVRDIVKGHSASVLKKEILHRDISFSNLLLSPHEKFHGVVIDWDLAKTMPDIIASQSTEGDSRTGTRAYQSVKVLRGSSLLGHHDNMDDIESIFYVLYYVLFGHDTSGKRLPDTALGDILHWEGLHLPPDVLSNAKHSFFYRTLRQSLSRFTGPERPTLVTFINELRDFFKIRMDSIDRALAFDSPIAFPVYSKACAKDDWTAFLKIIDAAIEKLPEVPFVPVAPPTPVHPSPKGKRNRDAAADDAEDDLPARKKANSNSPSDRAPSAEGSRSRRALSRPKYKDVSDSDDDPERASSPSPSKPHHDNSEYVPGPSRNYNQKKNAPGRS